jgi:hypothetical protein
MTILECPQCLSHRAIVLDTTPLRARCADCDCSYPIKTFDPDQADQRPASEARPRPGGHKKTKPDPIPVPSVGPLTEFIDAAIKGGPEGIRAAQREANRLTRRLGVTFDPEWLVCTKWLKDWASGSLGTRANGVPSTGGANLLEPRVSRVRVRVAMRWRAAWLAFYAMSGSKAMACRSAKVCHHTADYHIKNDPDFAALADAAKAHAIDLVHTRCFQRALEGDVEPVYWQGIVVGHVRKFDSKLQIEMLRAHMPNKFKTPGTGQINVETGDKILVMDEATRAQVDRKAQGAAP